MTQIFIYTICPYTYQKSNFEYLDSDIVPILNVVIHSNYIRKYLSHFHPQLLVLAYIWT